MTAPALTVRDRAIRSLEKLPPFSPILNSLIASLNDEDVSFDAIAALIEKDAVLTGNVLRLVNSALYNLRSTVHSVRQAVPVLGIDKVRTVAMIMSVAQMWKIKTPPHWSMERFNLHSVAVAVLSDLLARQLNVPHAEDAFAAGLLHDLGWLIVVIGLPDECKSMLELKGQDTGWKVDYELEILGLTHAELSAEALAAWNLPEPIQTAARYHIFPELDTTPTAAGQIPLSRIVHCAEHHVRDLGVLVKLFEDPVEDDNSPLQNLGLGGRLPMLLSDFENQFSAIRPYFVTSV